MIRKFVKGAEERPSWPILTYCRWRHLEETKEITNHLSRKIKTEMRSWGGPKQSLDNKVLLIQYKGNTQLPAGLLLNIKLMLQAQWHLHVARHRKTNTTNTVKLKRQRLVHTKTLIVTGDDVATCASEYRPGVVLPLRQPTGKGESLQIGSVLDASPKFCWL
jgi:hypothetical protein